MGAFLVAQALSPKGILIGLITLVLGYLLWTGVHFEKDYVAVKQANVTLQQNLTTTENTLKQQQKTNETNQIIAQTTLDSVRVKNQQDEDQIAILSGDFDALQTLRTPTNEDFSCVRSPYVSTILERMRDRASSDTNTGSSSTSNATTASGVNKTPSKTTNPTK